ncbi:hypothetical protein RN22_10360 [Grimontia sp. AD028]|uniref:hypothetical protein n=1 Tax=Grimontia sp. AD028 TaxID=1581149 RepID=UPI00061ACBE9|nr:hypothetical protein [Grimontia sp. AD028]KKD60579.1 hypothetical protein RN22_10360 [Grimontia sp. AD028]
MIRQPECLPRISQGASPALLNSDPPDPMNLLGKHCDFDYPCFAEYVYAAEKVQPAANQITKSRQRKDGFLFVLLPLEFSVIRNLGRSEKIGYSRFERHIP